MVCFVSDISITLIQGSCNEIRELVRGSFVSPC